MWCKHTNYEQAARIPVIVRVPASIGGVAGSTTAFVETVDIYPTLSDLAGVEISGTIDGKSFKNVLKDPLASHRAHATHVYPRGGRLGRAIRDARYRMVRWEPGRGDDSVVYELYDYQTDPLETQNVAADQMEIVQRLERVLTDRGPAKPDVRQSKSNDPSKTKQSLDSKNKSAKKSGSSKPAWDRGKGFDRRDADGDGYLTRDEFMTGQPDAEAARPRFDRFDKNGDGKLSKPEFVNLKK